ncbi:30S ribosomal protein S15 [Candidatus Nanohalovita haloferacivicina]|uniref:30S ribosomal protein S15 n=1 Tax=Candidatus Nanohalovita haloferacivicina TaxID=2978046 RepID=UPI00325FB2BF|nr:Ribosomal protein S15P [Candidatus Nanohalobia archaeon BNXNv]
MSRMHKSSRGSSGSSNPVDKKQPDWLDYDEEEVAELVLKLKDEGHDPSQIGMKLRDEYGIPDVKTVTGKKVTQILEENDAQDDLPEDLSNLVEKASNIKEHLGDNKKDENAERRLSLVEAKIRRLASYYREEGRIDESWKYSRDDQ